MYELWVSHGLRPSEYYNAGYGEKIILAAFMETELEEREKEIKRIRSLGKWEDG